MYEIQAPGESMLGGPVRLHRVGDGWSWLYGVSGRAVWASKEAAEKVAQAVRGLSWQGEDLGPGVVVETTYPGELQQ